MTFDYQGPNECRMLIDCGSLGNKSSPIQTRSIANYLQTIIDDGKKIDFLVATHEHLDHVSGFRKDLQPVLKENVGAVWLAWTENPQDPDAQRLKKHQHDLGAALQRVSQIAPEERWCQNLTSLLEFTDEFVSGIGFAKTVNSAMEFVRTGTGGKTTYFHPSDMVENQIPGFRVYVLGPPKEDQFLKNLGSHGSEALYGLMRAIEKSARLHQQELHLERNDTESEPDENIPFDLRFQQSGSKSLQEQYPTYLKDENAWRRIDSEWLSGSIELALQLDSLTNNTSLVLAFERIADGKVLLFAADAQEGNWLSWHEAKMKWAVTDAAGTPGEVRVSDLLSRTVFYKVGHHGSHNATAKDKGLELMTQEDELVAFIPVDRAIAQSRNPQGSWQMPARPLYRELLKRCQGRVVRSDLGWAAPATSSEATESAFLNMESNQQW
ncbi:MAG TPA: MBL fold metallo-hydrolase, partial [Planctomicrobium sp.]|nr:MBL fold metallo-hydrolase [Planctomicrobium sp.]